MNNKCIGCGAVLQCDDNKAFGYIPKNKFGNANYCERCFKITHYNEKLIIPLENINDYIIKEVNSNPKHVFFMVDLLNISEETLSTFKRIECPKTLIISKLDIIPKSIKEPLIISWLEKTYDIKDQISFISTKKNINTKTILWTLKALNKEEAYILGYTNAGKSTLINKISDQNEITDRKITTSLIPNTTIDFIKLNIKEYTLYDSPGFTLTNSLYKDNEVTLMNRILPKSTIKPITEQTKSNTSLIIENKMRINCNSKNSFTFYMSNSINMDKVFEKNTKFTDLPLKEYHIPTNSDLVIKGLGFINIKKECNITINTEYHDLIEIRPSMYGDDNNE